MNDICTSLGHSYYIPQGDDGRIVGGPLCRRCVFAPTHEQQKYVADALDWAEKSFKPDSTIGGPEGAA